MITTCKADLCFTAPKACSIILLANKLKKIVTENSGLPPGSLSRCSQIINDTQYDLTTCPASFLRVLQDFNRVTPTIKCGIQK